MVERISSLAYFVEHLELHFESNEVFRLENHEEIKHVFYSQCNDTKKVLEKVSNDLIHIKIEVSINNINIQNS